MLGPTANIKTEFEFPNHAILLIHICPLNQWGFDCIYTDLVKVQSQVLVRRNQLVAKQEKDVLGKYSCDETDLE